MAWRDNNREADRESKRRYRAKYPERKSEANRRYWENNRERKRDYRRNRKALTRGGVGKHRLEDIVALSQFQRGRCAYCRIKLTDKFHVDHIMPLKLGGSNERSNLQLTCGSCNHKKNAAHPLDFARSLGRLL
jgi:5-methylcytosine-specific restriction endonuclease McrA